MGRRERLGRLTTGSMQRGEMTKMAAAGFLPPPFPFRNVADGLSPPRRTQSLRSAGTLPPFSSSFLMTCLCSQTFIEAESFLSPV
ncbi:hypothetical protein GPNCGGLF_LOCUS415 [Methylorubrum aminovorans]